MSFLAFITAQGSPVVCDLVLLLHEYQPFCNVCHLNTQPSNHRELGTYSTPGGLSFLLSLLFLPNLPFPSFLSSWRSVSWNTLGTISGKYKTRTVKPADYWKSSSTFRFAVGSDLGGVKRHYGVSRWLRRECGPQGPRPPAAVTAARSLVFWSPTLGPQALAHTRWSLAQPASPGPCI